MTRLCLSLLVMAWLTLVTSVRAETTVDTPTSVDIHPGHNLQIMLGKDLQILRDPGGLMDLHTVQQLDLWKRSTKDVPGFGFDPAVYWVRVGLHNTGSVDASLMLDFAYSPMQHITLHTIDDSGKLRHTVEGGTRVPISGRPYAHTSHVFPLLLAPGERIICYLRFESEGSKTFPLKLWDRLAFEVAADQELYLGGTYMGILLALMLYSLFLFSFLREKLYLQYTGYLLGAALFFLALSGFGQPYLWGNFPTLAVYATPLAICLMGLTITPFSIRFLDIRSLSPRMYLLLRGVMAYSAVMLMLMPVLSYHIVISLLSIESIAAALLWYLTGVVARLRGHPLAGLYLVAWTLFLAGITIDALRLWGLIPTTLFTTNAIFVGSALESILLTYALAERIKSLDDASREAQEETRRHNQRIIESERDMQFRLEALVEEKTRELTSAQDSIITQQKLASVGVLSEGLAHELSIPAEKIAARLDLARRGLVDFERWLEKLVDDSDRDVLDEFRSLFRRIEEQQGVAEEGNLRIQSVVRGLTAATRINESRKQTCSPLAPLMTVLAEMRAVHPAIAFHPNLDDTPLIPCWPDSLAEAYRHILDNAVRALTDDPKGGGRINIQARLDAKGRELYLRIEDTGIGMTPDVLLRATDPFFTTRTVGSGTGLGLTMARDIISQHGGRFTLASTAGEGTCVTIRLPLPA